jgi:hypothetical protein
MLNRSFTVPLNFITDGAEILRQLRYKGKGYSEMVYILILRQNRETSVYESEYYGQIDMSKASDDPLRGITVSTSEGGLLSYFNANNNTTYDIPCDESVSDTLIVQDDGMTLQDKYNYQFLNTQISTSDDFNVFTTPAAFINNEGDSVGIVKNDSPFQIFTSVDDALASENYLLYSVYGISNVITAGILSLQINSGVGVIHVAIRTDLGQDFELYDSGTIGGIGQIVNIDLAQTFDLAINERLFIIITLQHTLPDPLVVTPLPYYFNISFTSRNTTTTLFARRMLNVGQNLVDKMTGMPGMYTFQSNLLTTNNSVALTCGDAIRQTDKTVVPVYYMSMSWQDFFTSVSACPLTADCGIKIVGKTLYLEKKSNLNNISGGVIFDLGEVAGLTIDTPEDLLVNLFKCGYPDQSYDQNAGKYEFNSTQEYGLPTTASQNPLDITSKFRADARGIEAIRGALLNKDTTDNSGDKQVFMIDISDTTISAEYHASTDHAQSYTSQQNIKFDNSGGNFFTIDNDIAHFTFTETYQRANILVTLLVDNASNHIQASLNNNNILFDTYLGSDTDGVTPIVLQANNVVLRRNDVITINILPSNPSAQTYSVVSATMQIDLLMPVYTLFRETYTALSGVLDDTIYNARLSPHLQLRAWAGYLKSLFYQQPTDQIIFNTGAKNLLFSRTVGGITTTENSNETIGNMPGTAYFIPYIFKFTTKIPYTFAQITAMLNAGYLKFSSNGITLYGLPHGTMTSKPATNEPQQWTVLAAPNNNLSSFLLLDQFSLTIQSGENLMYISAYNPVQFVKYDLTPQAKYQYKDMYDDWSFQRFNNFYAKPFYFQKWQTSDSINLQMFTSGEGQLQLFVYDDKGKQVSITPFNIISNSAVQPPFVLQQLSFTLNAGIYLFVIKNGAGDNLAVSEWQQVKAIHRNTHLYEYSSSYNKRNTFFNSWGNVMIRVEGQLMPADPDADFTEYADEEADVTMVHDNAWQKQKLYVGDNLGIPDFLALKINLITLLDTLLIEGIAYARDKDAKLENVGFRAGYPYSQYSTTVRKAINELGLTVVTDQDVTDNLATSWVIDQQAIGMDGDGVIDVTITNT